VSEWSRANDPGVKAAHTTTDSELLSNRGGRWLPVSFWALPDAGLLRIFVAEAFTSAALAARAQSLPRKTNTRGVSIAALNKIFSAVEALVPGAEVIAFTELLGRARLRLAA